MTTGTPHSGLVASGPFLVHGCGQAQGFFPGDMQEGFEPWFGRGDALQTGRCRFLGGDFACAQEIADLGQGMVEKL